MRLQIDHGKSSARKENTFPARATLNDAEDHRPCSPSSAGDGLRGVSVSALVRKFESKSVERGVVRANAVAVTRATKAFARTCQMRGSISRSPPRGLQTYS